MEFGHSSLQIASCFLLGKVTFRGIHSDLAGDLGPSNYISLEGFHRFSSSVETKEGPFFQSNTSLDSNFED